MIKKLLIVGIILFGLYGSSFASNSSSNGAGTSLKSTRVTGSLRSMIDGNGKFNKIEVNEVSSSPTPGADMGSFFFKTDGIAYGKNDAGTEFDLTSAGGGGGAPETATYITQTANGTLSGEQALGLLSTGIMRSATSSGVVTVLTDSAGIAANIDDETGTGVMVYGTGPTFITNITVPLIIGGTGSGDDLTFNSTSNGTKGSIGFGSLTTGLVYDETNTRLSIGSDENTVIVNTTTIGSKFTTHTDGATDLLDLSPHRHSDTAAFGAAIGMTRSRGSEASETAVQDNDVISRINFYGHDGTDYEIAGQIDCEVDGTVGANQMGGALIFSTTADGANSVTERIRIANDGAVTIAGSGILDSDGIDIDASNAYEIGGTAVISDSAGTATLSNIDEIDTTTETTFESAIDSLTNLTQVGTIVTGIWTGTTIAVANGGTGVTTSTGTGNTVLSNSPTFVTPALGTPASGVLTNCTGTAAGLTAGNVTTNANLTGVVTSTGNATAIAAKALSIDKLADGTDGELITWDASGVIATVGAGTSDQVLTSNGAGAAPTFQAGSGITLDTEQASTSGTAITFSSIPAGTKKITIMLVGVSTDGSEELLIQLGDSGGAETSGYISSVFDSSTSVASGSGFIVDIGGVAGSFYHGAIILSLENSTAFTWVSRGNIVRDNTSNATASGGSKSLSAELDRVIITTTGTPDDFDAGAINIQYQ